VRHENLKLPAYGGSLFDPDRFPFLEGRTPGTRWRETEAHPLAIDNLTVLDVLRSIQVLEVKVPGGGPSEARRLSFRALDVEQIGHVYEGLLDHTARRAKSPVLSLKGSKDHEPEIEVDELERVRTQGEDKLVEWLRKETGRTPNALRKAVEYQLPKDDHRKWMMVCDNSEPLYRRVTPWAGLVREDAHGRPVVFDEGAVYVTEGVERRATGTHYTPRSLTEPIVQYTLEPLVYEGPAEGWTKEKWKLKSARAILELKICDMAMGSGAFLVQTCRYLSERLVEAWEEAERQADGRLVVTPQGDLASGDPTERPLPRDPDERLAIARRVIADRCLYGVDKNPMAVEMAKLSLWLVTVQKDKPFTFLDHAFRCGDSLLGLTDRAQIEHFHIDPERGKRTHLPLLNLTRSFGAAFDRAMHLRRQLESFSVENASDADRKARMLRDAEEALQDVQLIADLVTAAALATADRADTELDALLERLSAGLAKMLEHHEGRDLRQDFRARVAELLETNRGNHHPARTPFHWVLEFPEVFATGGFHAFVSNPPFRYGTLASTELSDLYMRAIQQGESAWHGKADLVVGFLRRSLRLAHNTGRLGLLATSSILRGESLESGLRDALRRGFRITHGRSPFRWPGRANVTVIWFCIARIWDSLAFLDGREAPQITETLEPGGNDADIRRTAEPRSLPTASLNAFMGVKLSPANTEYLRGQRSVSEELRVALRHTLGGQDFYRLVNYEDAPLAVDPTRVTEQLAAGSLSAPAVRELRMFHHSRPAAALMEALLSSRYAFACAETSSVQLAFAPFPLDALPRHTLIVFPTHNFGLFTVLQSNLHDAWVWRWGLRRKRDLRYSPKRCGATFPLPDTLVTDDEQTSSRLRSIAHLYIQSRGGLMIQKGCGLTDLYALFHDYHETFPSIDALRDLHRELDEATAAAYGWQDIALHHGFQETDNGCRFTISESARRDIVDRLLELNLQRFRQAERVSPLGGTVDRTSATQKSRQSSEAGQINLALDDAAKTFVDDKQGGAWSSVGATDRMVDLLAFILDAHREHSPPGQVKTEKCVDILHRALRLRLERNPTRKAAGPLDYRALERARKRGEKRYAFSTKPGSRSGRLWFSSTGTSNRAAEFVRSLGDRAMDARRIIALLAPLNVDQAELAATLYAEWDESISRGRPVDDDSLVSAFYEWSEGKKRFPHDRVRGALRWLRENDLVPTGSGVGLEPQLSKEAEAVLRALKVAYSPLTKAEVLKAAGLREKKWNAAIRQLKEGGLVVTEGRGRGVRYRPVTEGSDG